MLALAGSLARQQRRGDRLRRGDRGQLVGKDGPQQSGTRFVRAGLNRRQPGKALDHRVVSRLCRVWTLLAEAADRDIDDLRRDGADGPLPDPEALGDAGTKVLDKDIGASGKLQQGLAAALRFQVENDRALVAVVVEERGRKSAPAVGAAARRVAAIRRLHLDHIGALVGEDHRRERPRHIRGQIDDSIAMQWTRHAITLLEITVTPPFPGTTGLKINETAAALPGRAAPMP